jgi:hypothetical protein
MEGRFDKWRDCDVSYEDVPVLAAFAPLGT